MDMNRRDFWGIIAAPLVRRMLPPTPKCCTWYGDLRGDYCTPDTIKYADGLLKSYGYTVSAAMDKTVLGCFSDNSKSKTINVIIR